MYKLFYKSLITVFLYLILIANLIMFFQIITPLNMVGFDPSAYENSYFGVSSLIDLIKYLPNTPLYSTSQRIGELASKLFTWSATAFNEGLSFMFKSFDGHFDSGDILFILFWGFYLVIQALSSLVSFSIGVAGVVIGVIYAIFLVVSLVQYLILFINGYYAKGLPKDWYGLRDIIAIIPLQSV